MATSILLPDSTFEDHFSLADLAKKWRVSRSSVRLQILDEPGVVRISFGKTSMTRYSIPASVARRVHARLTAMPAVKKVA